MLRPGASGVQGVSPADLDFRGAREGVATPPPHQQACVMMRFDISLISLGEPTFAVPQGVNSCRSGAPGAMNATSQWESDAIAPGRHPRARPNRPPVGRVAGAGEGGMADSHPVSPTSVALGLCCCGSSFGCKSDRGLIVGWMLTAPFVRARHLSWWTAHILQLNWPAPSHCTAERCNASRREAG